MTSSCAICKHAKKCVQFYKHLRSCSSSLNDFTYRYSTYKFNMPRKSKRNKFKPCKVNQYGEVFTNTRAVLDGTSPIDTLNYFFEIFANRVEKDVIKLILDECDYNVDQASETLMSLCSEENKGLPKNSEEFIKNPSLNCSLPLTNNVTLNPESPEFEFPYSLSKSKSFSDTSAESYPDKSIISEQSKFFREAHAQSFNAYSSWNYGASSNEESNQEVTPASQHFSLEPSYSDKIKMENLEINEEAPSNSTSNSFFASIPTFIVPSVPMHGSPSVRKSPGLDANKGFWNLNNSRHFSTSSSNESHDAKNSKIVREVIDKIKCNNRILVILRGLPGSGKSTLAFKLKFSGVILSTDDFFYKRGKYLFDPNQLPEAHEWNRLRTKKALEKGVTPVIIDNTNVEAWEMKPYILLGKKYDYEIVILEPNTPWKFNVNSLALRNKHSVPKSKIAKMKERYQNDLTVEKILGSQMPFSSNTELINSEQSFELTDVKPEKTSLENLDTLKDNHILLEAVVHTEDNSSIQNSSLHLDFESKFQGEVVKSNEIESMNDNKQTNTTNCENFSDNPIETACDLDELRALAMNDSEDSQSLYSSVNGSLPEIYGWEAITEHDNDFHWSTSSKELNDNFFYKSRSVDSLHLEESTDSSFVEDVTSSSKNSNENISCSVNDFSAVELPKNASESIQTNSNLFFKKIENDTDLIDFSNVPVSENSELRYFDQNFGSFLSDIHTDAELKESAFFIDNPNYQQIWSEGHNSDEITNQMNITDFKTNSPKTSSESLHISEEIDIDCKTENQAFVPTPKPQRSNCEDVVIRKNSFLKKIAQIVPENLPEKVLENDSSWNDRENENCMPVKENHSDSKVNSFPKPQREIFRNSDVASRFSLRRNENSDASPSKNKNSLLNISIDEIGQQWEFPELNTYFIPVQENIKKNESSTESVHSQTEPQDFDFLYKISFAKDVPGSCDYEIISARAYSDITDKNDDLISIADEANCNYLSVLSFDKSTSTNDMEEDVEISQKLDHLQNCFPDISKDDLLHLLEICCNDESWMTDLILDWGYKYNVPAEELKNKIKNDGEENYFSINMFKKNVEIPTIDTNSSSVDTDDNKSSSSKSQSEELDEVQSLSESVKTLQLELDPVFACQLEELFGPVPCSGNMVVDIDIELAKLIHEKWKSTPIKEFSTEIDEKSNSDSPRHFNMKKTRKSRPVKIRSENSSKILYSPAHKEPSTLSEIMDMEYAHQLYKKEKLKDEDLMTKLRRSELYNMFPGADTGVLDEIFESNNYSLEDSLHAIGPDISEEETVEKKKSVEKFDAYMKDWEKAQIFQDFENNDWSSWVYQNDSLGSIQDSSISSPSTASLTVSSEAAELREKAAKHYQLRQEFIQKAQAAYCRGMKDVASFYAQKGNEQGKIAKDINKQAAALIAQERNILSSCLKIDLHGLHVQEAISLLEKFLSDKKLELRRRQHSSPLVVTVITGQGLHSIIKAKLRPAVMNYLKSNKYNFTEIKTGIIEVTVMLE